MALELGVAGDRELEMEKSSVGSGKAGYFSLTIIYLVFMFFCLIYLEVYGYGWMGVVTTLRIPLLQRLDTYIAKPLNFNLFVRTVSESP